MRVDWCGLWSGLVWIVHTRVWTIHTRVWTIHTAAVWTIHTVVWTIHTAVWTIHTAVWAIHTPVWTIHTPVWTILHIFFFISTSLFRSRVSKFAYKSGFQTLTCLTLANFWCLPQNPESQRVFKGRIKIFSLSHYQNAWGSFSLGEGVGNQGRELE